MANTTRINKTKSVNYTVGVKYTSSEQMDGVSVKKIRICQNFTKFTYANAIIGAVFFLMTLVALFGASTYNDKNWWLGFWMQKPIQNKAPVLSAFGIIVIILDCSWFLLFAGQFIGNLVLHNKITLSYVPKIIIALVVTIAIMLFLGASCKPSFIISEKFYISWMRMIKNNNHTTLTSGAIVILFEMILVYLGCIAYIAYYYISMAKKNKKVK